MNSVDRVKTICKERGIAISRLEKDLGFSNGYIGQLRKGVFPADRIKLISDYLNVSMDYLMTGKEEPIDKAPELTARDERDISKDVERIMAKLSAGEDGPASYDGQELDPEAAELFRDELEIALRRLKIINKEKYTPSDFQRDGETNDSDAEMQT